ncbi:hypothetical protein P7F88_18730 [Vibrio hannami]|uniref:hypothetical protein n=1 Tax=Vibrio hannami TaxID=2717094 RepID=UPI00240F5321|nr:hypothetical protein [Vibrio hannami]MDG3088003.1 hypothetical protein [Vibrio hannami]
MSCMDAVNKKYHSIISAILLSASFAVNSAPAENLIEEANSGNPQAQLELGRSYYSDNQIKLAHYWYLRALKNGNDQTLTEFGKLYEDFNNRPLDSLIFAENWYELANELGLPDAEEGYARVLETQFNKRRQKQVSSIALLDEAADKALHDGASVTTASTIDDHRISSNIVIFVAVLIALVLAISIRRFFRQKKQTKLGNYEKQLTESRRKIRSLQTHLNKAHEQLSRLQRNNQAQSRDQSYALACSLLGFNPNRVPDQKALKLRYKKLSRVYHPDAGGSEDEMKRLNAAVKIVTSYK